ncbi:MDR family MFS transporter [Rahnella sikkimica]|uniref:MFS transporter n=1 Tax=Rahnella sikkimica TaxID=1805933 RepID=A0A2L1UNT8_9GAMM|nr:MDR family MFS transporter [Rahnella sikkimica]AVF34582.1 MFS transporter [Rahnella sikkimica]
MAVTTPVVKSSHRPLILTACMLSMFMAAVEVTIVATAMPTIIGDLGGFSLLGWVFAVYLLTQAITVPIYGRLADLYGCRKMFFIGTTLFLIGSVLCGFAPSLAWMIAFRALQGLGAGAITPIATTLIANVYGPQERAKAQGYLSSVWGVSAIVGPLMGAFIVSHFPWAVVFWVNVPIGLVAMAILLKYLPPDGERKQHKLDLAGTGYLTLSVAALLLALLQAEVLGYWALALIVLSVISEYLLIRQERKTPEPLFPLALWESKVIIAGNIGGLIIGATMMGISAFLPTYVQGVLGGTPLEAGTTLALMSIGWPLASMISSRLMQASSYRATAVLGGVLLLGGSVALLFLSPDSGLWMARLAAFSIGAGMGLSNTTFLVSVQNNAEPAIRGIATASTLFTRMLGSAIGTAVLGATLNLNLQYRLPQVNDPVQQLMEKTTRNAMESHHLAAMIESVAASLHWVFMVSAIISVLAVAAGLLIPAGDRPHTEPQQES